jgi:hypothetical protein
MQEWRITRHTPAMVRNAQRATSEYQKKTSATGVENHQTGKGFEKKKDTSNQRRISSNRQVLRKKKPVALMHSTPM